MKQKWETGAPRENESERRVTTPPGPYQFTNQLDSTSSYNAVFWEILVLTHKKRENLKKKVKIKYMQFKYI